MLRTRVITALILLFGFLAALFMLPAFGWLIVVAGIGALAAWEWGGFCGFSRTLRHAFCAAIGLAVIGGGMLGGLTGPEPAPRALFPIYAVAVVFWFLCVPFWLKRRWHLGSAGAVIGVVVLLPTALAMAHLRALSPWLLLAAMSVVWLADIAAYFAGRRWGRRKLAPEISPGKSWEGAYGALVAVPLYGVAVLIGALPHPLSVPGYVGIALCLVPYTGLSIMGDLYESLLKRQAGLKDSGKLLPGHGGVLDRIDSLTSTLPLAALIALWYFS